MPSETVISRSEAFRANIRPNQNSSILYSSCNEIVSGHNSHEMIRVLQVFRLQRERVLVDSGTLIERHHLDVVTSDQNVVRVLNFKFPLKTYSIGKI